MHVEKTLPTPHDDGLSGATKQSSSRHRSERGRGCAGEHLTPHYEVNLAFYLSLYIPNLKNRALLMSCERAASLSGISSCSCLLLTTGSLLLGEEKRGFLVKHRAHLPRGCVPQH